MRTLSVIYGCRRCHPRQNRRTKCWTWWIRRSVAGFSGPRSKHRGGGGTSRSWRTGSTNLIKLYFVGASGAERTVRWALSIRRSSSITASPPTMRDLTSLRLKIFNSSSKSEFIGNAGNGSIALRRPTAMPLEVASGPEELPIFDVERAVHFRQTTVAFHDEGCRCLLHKRALIYSSFILAPSDRAVVEGIICA